MLSTFRSPLLLLGLSATVQAGTKYLGMAISGIDFNCDITGICPFKNVEVPLASLGGADSAAQMKHFVDDDGLNMFRLPVSWQFLLDGDTIGTFNSDRVQNYDDLMQACLVTGAYCMIDLHNFARFENKIIGQGGPSNEDFADFWTTVATKYANESKVVFELMNEPHDLDIGLWADTCQAAVTAIRKAGATTQMILLPGTFFDSAATLSTDGSGDALFKITNPDGTTDNLLLDIHKYLDNDNSGSNAECTTDNVGNFTVMADYLRKEGRLGLISETGASSDASCMTRFRAQNEYINKNSDVFVGLVAWAAGNFATSYVLSLTPSLDDGKYVDNDLMKECVLAPWNNGTTTTNSATSSASKSSSTSTKSSSSKSSTSSTTKSTAKSSMSTSTIASTSATATATAASLPENAGSALATSTTAASKSGAVAVLGSASRLMCGLFVTIAAAALL
ncbi:endoglucanase 2 [Grosmannia clavigera kw1407]|uniref:Endoglucanase EG-II n=1 Tax=Grosmannia clavigera (strain kw1407 / UAMH 11150) TaxID=655863 RepID=F0X776_GROCL|nr:endoglucanase 2 [Grosmannia clavigera kw1407]EFX06636.1 endoglucanase 2 [Grosmannia clavigera kw1407]